MRRFATRLATLAGGLAICGAANAGPTSDALSKCMVAKSTPQDRVALVQWYFAALSVNASVKPYTTFTPDQRVAVTKHAVDIMQRLIITDCRQEALTALHQDGAPALQSSFEALGRQAAGELTSDPAVVKQMSSAITYADPAKWATFLQAATK